MRRRARCLGDHAACTRSGLFARFPPLLEQAWVRVAREGLGPEGRVVHQQWLANTPAPGVGAQDRRRLDLVLYGATRLGEALCCDMQRRPSRRSLLPLRSRGVSPPRGLGGCARSAADAKAGGGKNAKLVAPLRRNGRPQPWWALLSAALQRPRFHSPRGGVGFLPCGRLRRARPTSPMSLLWLAGACAASCFCAASRRVGVRASLRLPRRLRHSRRPARVGGGFGLPGRLMHAAPEKISQSVCLAQSRRSRMPALGLRA